jgi:phosphoserine phosphatase RsbU/P
MPKSLSTKIFSILIIIPILSFSIYLYINYKLFSSDKIEFAMLSSTNQAESIAQVFNLSLDQGKDFFRHILDQKSRANSQLVNDTYFHKQDLAQAVFLLGVSDRFMPIPKLLIKKKNFDLESINIKDKSDELIDLLKDTDIYLSSLNSKNDLFLFAHKFSLNNSIYYMAMIANFTQLTKSFSTPGELEPYLINKDIHLSIKPDYWRESQLAKGHISANSFSKIFDTGMPTGAYIYETNLGKKIIGYSRTINPSYFVATALSYNNIFSVIDILLNKSAIFLLGLISIVTLIAGLFSRSISQKVILIRDQTEQIASGNFNTDLKLGEGDEFFTLSKNISSMANKIKNLLESNIKQAHLESEMTMVQKVQSNIFPELKVDTELYDLNLYFEPASFSGGDWFHYTRHGSKLILWIGDATGHGAPAAMVTSVAKSASSLLEKLNLLKSDDPSILMEALNHAVYSTAKSSVMMTFCIISIDLDSYDILYCNASHEAPIIIPHGSVSKRDFRYMLEISGPRLGQAPNSQYRTYKETLSPQDRLFLYTDGLIDLCDKNGAILGEGRLNRTLMQLFNTNTSSSDICKKLTLFINQYRSGAPLSDDLMFMVLNLKS